MDLSEKRYSKLIGYAISISKNKSISGDLVHEAYIKFITKSSHKDYEFPSDNDFVRFMSLFIKQAHIKHCKKEKETYFCDSISTVCFQPEVQETFNLIQEYKERNDFKLKNPRFSQNFVKIRDKKLNKRPWRVKKSYRFV